MHGSLLSVYFRSKELTWIFLYLMHINFFLFTRAEYDATNGEIKEYCTSEESFEARCLKNEVIVMTSAVYGRMRMGRCLEDEEVALRTAFGDDPKFLGCSDNVLELMDNKCSGKIHCEVRLIFDNDFRKFKPCLTALKLYLEASYECVTVIEPDRSCVVSASSNLLHILHTLDAALGCGTKVQPWLIEAPIGQQITVDLLEFGPDKKLLQTSEVSLGCTKYGYVFEKSSGKNVSICGRGLERNSVVYKSQSNVIQVVLHHTRHNGSDMEQPRILIGFHAIGCTNLIPPTDAWLRRNGNEATVGCYTSRQSWLLRCSENQWTGVIGNCTQADITEVDEVQLMKKAISTNINEVTIMVVVVFLTLIICLTIICFGAVCLKRYYSLKARQQFQLVEDSYKKFSTADRKMSNKPMNDMDVPLRLT